ncbi:hypothetical protein Mal4_57980 [Maioricimonas rarisocia]|uniref:PPi-type phosphoenolpyruvate carboxykinase lobe 2 domain-containing protein n=1 Tax=Maioricimonas rarisocia TaxID=2528026 RepID=A0A517ZG39_9PLAN|nr:hypothetical protein [Maioricimonas rarisocia]QDU41431.1 hypothetical protein Mal4_57980 [Maioricimonas rarisocia]
MDMKLALGFREHSDRELVTRERRELLRYINLKLAANGAAIEDSAEGAELVTLASGLLKSFRERSRRLRGQRPPIDVRVERFLNEYFADLDLTEPLQVPAPSVVLDRHGLARELSLPSNGDSFESELVKSYRVANGVLHNPRADRRTTKGTFHIAEGGLPIPDDKRSVPRQTFVELFRHAMRPPRDLMLLPFTSQQAQPAHFWVSVMLRPTVCPEVKGVTNEKSMETHFFAPGSLVSNLDFVESIFGNAGDPFVPGNDAALDVEHWTGHTGCVILAPHLTSLRKKDLGLPHISEATERQIRDRMCWENEDEVYNDGGAFKLTCRDASGVVVTLIADNYFGYCKKEVKTQISYAANLMGGAEEEHAGGALVFPSYNLGEQYQMNSRRYNNRTFDDVTRDYGEWIDVKPEGYGVDRNFSDLIYIPEDAAADLQQQNISWMRNGQKQSIPLLPGQVYMAPSGYKLRMEKHPSAPSWRLIGTSGEGTFCHKPCTVSGGGKSEISKSLKDYMQYGSVFVSEFEKDMDQVAAIFERDFSQRWSPDLLAQQNYDRWPSRPILSRHRSLGSVIKLLTPSDDYNDEYNAWLKSIPNHIYALVFAIKRFHQDEWGDNWREHFNVDQVNGSAGHELKLHDRKLVGTYLRVGFLGSGWRMFKVRQDFAAAAKVQTEDDISASVVVPARKLQNLNPDYEADSFKFVTNCEYRLFQRPDDAIHRGFDKQAEADLARRDVNFVSNFEPLTRAEIDDMMTKVVDFDSFTDPVKQLLLSLKDDDPSYVVCSDNPRRIGGERTKNPRYLQDRPDVVDPMPRYVAEMGVRLFRKIPADQPVHMPVNAVLSGRRNNPPETERGIRSLAVYNPIHYQELPELFMDYVSSLTGKSPSTTGAGSEGALTKGPFNALPTIVDLNGTLVSMILTGLAGYSTAAGHVGPNNRFDHDISLLVPEVWSRMSPEERDPTYLIRHKLLEPVKDIEQGGETVPAHRLGYRINQRFIRRFFGRVFDNPDKVFDRSILAPETQDMESFVDGVKYICEAHERVARQYFADGSVEDACPPLKALLHIMAHGSYEGKTELDPEIRQLFTREALLSSDWYEQRLHTKQHQDQALWRRHLATLDEYLEQEPDLESDFRTDLLRRRELAEAELSRVSAPTYLEELSGTIGADPSLLKG